MSSSSSGDGRGYPGTAAGSMNAGGCGDELLPTGWIALLAGYVWGIKMSCQRSSSGRAGLEGRDLVVEGARGAIDAYIADTDAERVIAPRSREAAGRPCQIGLPGNCRFAITGAIADHIHAHRLAVEGHADLRIAKVGISVGDRPTIK